MKHPENSQASWYKDGVLLQEVQDLVRRFYMGPDGSLSIDPTMMSDLGEYECKVRNSDGELQTAKAFLNIQCGYFAIIQKYINNDNIPRFR